MAKIEAITAREYLDSRGNPTVGVQVVTGGGFTGFALVPSGASIGEHEARELRDDDMKRYMGLGVLKAVDNIADKIQPVLIGQDSANQEKIDYSMIDLDGTDDKSHLGANALLAVSLACAKAQAACQGVPLYQYLGQYLPQNKPALPAPIFNIINGAAHASNNLSVQEFEIIPISAKRFAESLRMGVEVYMSLKLILKNQGAQLEVADEGGFAPRMDNTKDAFKLLVQAIETAGYQPGTDIVLGIDAAASAWYDSSKKQYLMDNSSLSPEDLSLAFQDWIKTYPIISIEDPFSENEWKNWGQFSKQVRGRVQIIGDDLYTTNPNRINERVKKTATTAVLIKPNQIGTLTETFKAITEGTALNQKIIISHRSGDTEDTFISDLAVAIGDGQIKCGAPCRAEHTAKYNRLLTIESSTNFKLATPLSPYLQR